jgi:hypothetical protein
MNEVSKCQDSDRRMTFNAGAEHPAGVVSLDDDTLGASYGADFTTTTACSFWGACI